MPAKLADMIVGSIANYVSPDPYAGEEGFYYVNSIYFDSADFHCYQEKLAGVKNRKKYRLRYYGEDENLFKPPLFFEIKRKIDSVILKDRVVVNRSHLEKINSVSWRDILENNPKFFNEFYYDYLRLRLSPRLFVRYKRKPYYSRFDRKFRITFDYDLQAGRINRLGESATYKRSILNKVAVMEVKFNGVMPSWFAEIIRANNLKRASFSKYCNSLNIMYNLKDELSVLY